MERWFQLRKEDEVVRPFVLRRCVAAACCGEKSWSEGIAGPSGEVTQAAGHVLAEKVGWVVVELVGFVAVDGLLLVGEVDWWLA